MCRTGQQQVVVLNPHYPLLLQPVGNSTPGNSTHFPLLSIEVYIFHKLHIYNLTYIYIYIYIYIYVCVCVCVVCVCVCVCVCVFMYVCMYVYYMISFILQ